MEEKKCLIALNMVAGLGPVTIKKLLDKFHTAKGILEASTQQLQYACNINKEIAKSILSISEDVRLQRELRLIKDYNAKVFTVEESEYPQNLKHIYDPPVAIYVKGEILPEDNLAVAIVGTRIPSAYGSNAARRLAAEFAREKITVISGLARGIDSAAHQGALEAGGRTIAVLGSGFLNIYPPENKELAKEISHAGAVISEFPMETKPLKGNFPCRNRIISGLSLAVIVVEAAARSGSLITANCALDQGREVFAVPNVAKAVTSQGTHCLIRQGAILIETSQDVIEELQIFNQPQPSIKK